ncbi:hypothetical protein OUZ56_032693 [Daphnia magna]|uniref:Uncharacterized protein n=1 Tax=Daphnia magna TaxID=35525 RepID=A0ABQ9ZX50_9CRUS|nr:hypothetical protein OUZ56_032693 [Daphnia magna]
MNWTLPTVSIGKFQRSTSTSLQSIFASSLGRNEGARTLAELVEKSTCQLKEEDEIRIHLQSISSSYPYALLAGKSRTTTENELR